MSEQLDLFQKTPEKTPGKEKQEQEPVLKSEDLRRSDVCPKCGLKLWSPYVGLTFVLCFTCGIVERR